MPATSLPEHEITSGMTRSATCTHEPPLRTNTSPFLANCIVDELRHPGIGFEGEIKASVIILMRVMAEDDESDLEIKILGQLKGTF